MRCGPRSLRHTSLTAVRDEEEEKLNDGDANRGGEEEKKGEEMKEAPKGRKLVSIAKTPMEKAQVAAGHSSKNTTSKYYVKDRANLSHIPASTRTK